MTIIWLNELSNILLKSNWMRKKDVKVSVHFLHPYLKRRMKLNFIWNTALRQNIFITLFFLFFLFVTPQVALCVIAFNFALFSSHELCLDVMRGILFAHSSRFCIYIWEETRKMAYGNWLERASIIFNFIWCSQRIR